MLESQLQTERKDHAEELNALKAELHTLKEEKDQQQQLLSHTLQLPQDGRVHAALQHEISRLTNQNLVRTERSQDLAVLVCGLDSELIYFRLNDKYIFDNHRT